MARKRTPTRVKPKAPKVREEVFWYYRLGESILGPVPWTDIAALIADTVKPEELRVAIEREGEWHTAAEVLKTMPELTGAPPAHPPDPAATPPAPLVQMVPGPGLGRWLHQGWLMVWSEPLPWMGATLIFAGGSVITAGLALPGLLVGLHRMALRSFDGEVLRARDVLRGLRRFWGAWAVLIEGALVQIGVVAPFLLAARALGDPGTDTAEGLGVLALLIVGALAVLTVQVRFFYVWALLAEERPPTAAVRESWRTVARYPWKHLGAWAVLGVIPHLGLAAFGMGWLLTFPLLPCATAAAYRWHFPQRAPAEAAEREA